MKPFMVVSVAGAGILLVAGAAVAVGVVPVGTSEDSARPPCAALPDERAVSEAVAAHRDLVSQIERVGPGVKVAVGRPCKDQSHKAIVSIVYTTTHEREGVNRILTSSGFDAPAELIHSGD